MITNLFVSLVITGFIVIKRKIHAVAVSVYAVSNGVLRSPERSLLLSELGSVILNLLGSSILAGNGGSYLRTILKRIAY